MLTVEQKGGRIEGGLLTDDFFDSTPSALNTSRSARRTKGAQQFFTPPEVADFIACCLFDEPDRHPGPVFDPVGAGAGNLLKPYPHRFGVEIDRDHRSAPYQKIVGDCQKVLDLALAIGLECKTIVANPPFGLKWRWGDFEGRSARAAWLMINDLLPYNAGGAIIMPFSDYVWAKDEGHADFVAAVRCPSLFGKDIEIECVIAFFTTVNVYSPPSEFTVSGPDELPSLVPRIREMMAGSAFYNPSEEDDEFRKKFTLLQREFAEREKNQGRRRSFIQVRNDKIRIYLSPFEKARLLNEGRKDIIERAQELHGQSIYQFVKPREWRIITELADEGELEIGQDVLDAYDKVQTEAEFLRSPMLKTGGAALRVAALRDEEKIRCIKDTPPFKAGQTYDVKSQTITIKEEATRQKLVTRKDPRTSKPRPEIITQDLQIERKAIRFEIGGQEYILSNDRDADLITWLAEHFDLPEVRTIAELRPDEYAHWVDRIRQVVERYDQSA